MCKPALAALAIAAAALAPAPAIAQQAETPQMLPGDAITNPSPSAEEVALGRALAETGTLAALAPLMTGQETEQMLADLPDLTPAEQDRLRAIAAATAAAGRGRLLDALGRQYAMRLSAEEMRALAAFARTPAAQKMQAALPYTIAGTMQAVGSIDFKGETLAALCAETGKGCAE
ncbi:hypothetical protein [Qipengyuania sp. MTN3-11]|uniref:hypothetical protein n=1 Tax=Qipengyuania sp. MTN3-11 TaxID=3056557 RepID=UPI0036F2F90D